MKTTTDISTILDEVAEQIAIYKKRYNRVISITDLRKIFGSDIEFLLHVIQAQKNEITSLKVHQYSLYVRLDTANATITNLKERPGRTEELIEIFQKPNTHYGNLRQ